MNIYSAYSVKIKHYSRIFADTIQIYRSAVDFLINVCVAEWDTLSKEGSYLYQQKYVENLIHSTKNHTALYAFDDLYYKFPSYLRRSAIMEAIGKVSSYQSNLKNWMDSPIGKKPSCPKAGYIYPCLYKEVMYQPTGTYSAKIKCYVRNTWDWLYIDLRKSDVDYITHHCSDRRQCPPTLMKRGKEWFLDFSFEEKVKLTETPVKEQTVLAVDLGINNACTISIMHSDGTILGRRFLSLPREQDSLMHNINRIKKAQQHGNHRTPRLWAKAKGTNNDISVKTAAFIIETAKEYHADVIVFEHLEKGKASGSKKQKLHLWRSQYVQQMVTDKAHRLGMRISHINARNTSRLAYDGSGYVERGIDGNYSICRFQSGKIYHCDLSASYNIGARYFIREILKSLSETVRLQLEAKVPQACKRSTCTFSTLISLNAELKAIA